MPSPPLCSCSGGALALTTSPTPSSGRHSPYSTLTAADAFANSYCVTCRQHHSTSCDRATNCLMQAIFRSISVLCTLHVHKANLLMCSYLQELAEIKRQDRRAFRQLDKLDTKGSTAIKGKKAVKSKVVPVTVVVPILVHQVHIVAIATAIVPHSLFGGVGQWLQCALSFLPLLTAFLPLIAVLPLVSSLSSWRKACLSRRFISSSSCKLLHINKFALCICNVHLLVQQKLSIACKQLPCCTITICQMMLPIRNTIHVSKCQGGSRRVPTRHGG